MKTKLSIVAIILLMAGFANAQKVVEGVTFQNNLKAGNESLLLNGAGLREKYFLDLYVAGLYLKAKNNDAEKIMAANEPMAIRMQIVSGLIDSEKMIEAVDEGFKKSSKANLATLNDRVNKFKACFSKEPIKKGDVYELVYVPATGVTVSKNGKVVDTITGLDFKKGLFGIWLCNEPADAGLKAGMLGK